MASVALRSRAASRYWVGLDPPAAAPLWPAYGPLASLRAQFGDFWIAHPLSAAMQAFVTRHATPEQRHKIAEHFARSSSDIACSSEPMPSL